ncbi:MAG TPA: hypothetical protein VEA69_18815 [Tepidisphaeraceae bacterium]|nr:hypothetical protein [Tepidisphaeraceae bacterium]
MPYAMCPICGATTHMNVSDPAAWYAERHPAVPFGELAPEPCPHCFAELAVGDRVVTRRWVNENAPVEAGQQGELVAVYANPAVGRVYVVALASGRRITVPRAAIRKRRGSEG